MTEEVKEKQPASEDVTPNAEESRDEIKEKRQVPLEALEAERKKRQEFEYQARLYQELANRAEQKNSANAVKEEDHSGDDEDYVNKGDLKRFYQKLTKEELHELKREIAEQTFKDTRPEAVRDINEHLKEILERRPWLAETIERAPNRYARAYEIVQDYMPKIAVQKDRTNDAKKIVENAQKPGSPVNVGKSQKLSKVDYMRSIAGTNEFRDYRKKLLGR